MVEERTEMWSAIRGFSSTALTPLATVGRLAQWVTLGIAVVTLIGVGSFLSPWAWVGILGLATLLTTWAGIRLQRERDARRAPSFSVRPEYDRRRDRLGRAGNWQEEASLWAVVENDGPSAEFTARVRDVEGVDYSGEYLVEALAWEYGEDRDRYLIDRGNRGRVRLARTLRIGRSGSTPSKTLRFFLPHAGMWGNPRHAGHGVGQELAYTDRVTFRLEVVNVTDDTERAYRALLLFDEDGTVADFRFEP